MSTAGMLLAVWFVNPALLGWLGLGALPIVIHIFSRRRYRRIEWGATRFLWEADQENRRRVRFEQWLLMVLRCLAMVLLVLLAARPFVQPGLLAALLGERTEVSRVIVIDDSASLSYSRGLSDDFAVLRAAGQRLLDWLGNGAAVETVTLYVTSKPEEPLAVERKLTSATVEDLQRVIGELKPTNMSARPRRVMSAIAKQLQAAEGAGRTDVYILSDFQRSDWIEEGMAGGASVFEPLNQLDPEAVRVVLIAGGSAERDNVAVASARLERSRVIAGLPALIDAELVNYSREELVGAQARIEVNGTPLPTVSIEPIASGKSQQVSVEVTFPDEGYTELAVGVDTPDGLGADNTFRMAPRVRGVLEVLLVDGQPAPDPMRDEVYYLRNALAPAGPFSSGLRVEVVDSEQLTARQLERFDCVMMCNVAVPGIEAVAALERYVRQGGGLVFFLGSEVGDPGEYNRIFYADGEGLLPLALEAVRRAGSAMGVGMVRGPDHPVTVLFAEEGESLEGRMAVKIYYGCETLAAQMSRPDQDSVASESRGARLLAYFSDEDKSPALVERDYGAGRVLMFTSSVDLDWNNWARALDGSYVVTMLELTQYAARRNNERDAYNAGELLTLALSPEQYAPAGLFRAPAGVDAPVVAARLRGGGGAVGEPIVLEGPVAEYLGTYTVELTRRDGVAERRPLSVNLEQRESDLRRAGGHELDLALSGISHEQIDAGGEFLRDDETTRRELWSTVLVVLAVVLMLEQTLAWWFGTPRHAARHHPRLAQVFARFGAGTR